MPPASSPLNLRRSIFSGDRRTLDPSGPAVADRDLAPFEDDRHAAPSLRQGQHLLEEGAILLDVVILDLVLLVRESLPGRGRVRSGVLPEDANGGGHLRSSIGSVGLVSRGGLEPPTR